MIIMIYHDELRDLGWFQEPYFQRKQFLSGVQKGVPQESTKNGMLPAKHDHFVFFQSVPICWCARWVKSDSKSLDGLVISR